MRKYFKQNCTLWDNISDSGTGCEVSESGTREKNDGTENTIMDESKKIEVHSNDVSFAEDRNEPQQNEVPEWIDPDKPPTIETRRRGREKTSMKDN